MVGIQIEIKIILLFDLTQPSKSQIEEIVFLFPFSFPFSFSPPKLTHTIIVRRRWFLVNFFSASASFGLGLFF
jgi:hypothetical protein